MAEDARPSKRARLTAELEARGAEGREMLAELECSICQEVMEDPVQVKASGQTYCRACITAALNNMPVCPLTGTPVPVRGGNVDGALQANHLVRSLIDGRRVCCAWEGCNERPKLGEVEAHERNCAHAIVTCSRCAFRAGRAAVLEHEKSCPFVVLAPELDKRDARISALEAQVEVQRRDHDSLKDSHQRLKRKLNRETEGLTSRVLEGERLMGEQRTLTDRLQARLDALEAAAKQGGRAVTPERPPRDAVIEHTDLTFVEEHQDRITFSNGLISVRHDDARSLSVYPARAVKILSSGTHSWKIRVVETDTWLGFGVATAYGHLSCYFHIRGKSIYASGDPSVAITIREFPYDAFGAESIVKVTYVCETGELTVDLVGHEGIARYTDHRLAGMRISPFVRITSGNTVEFVGERNPDSDEDLCGCGRCRALASARASSEPSPRG